MDEDSNRVNPQLKMGRQRVRELHYKALRCVPSYASVDCIALNETLKIFAKLTFYSLETFLRGIGEMVSQDSFVSSLELH